MKRKKNMLSRRDMMKTGAFIGAALIEVIRNSLLLAGVDPYWQGTFVGAFIILAVLLQRIRGKRAD